MRSRNIFGKDSSILTKAKQLWLVRGISKAKPIVGDTVTLEAHTAMHMDLNIVLMMRMCTHAFARSGRLVLLRIHGCTQHLNTATPQY